MEQRVLPPPPEPGPTAAEKDTATPSETHPIAFGLLALFGVGLAIGLVLALGALMVSEVLLGGADDGAGSAAAERSMYIPDPSSSAEAGGPGPLVSMQPHQQPQGKKDQAPQQAISLQAAQTSVGPMEQIDLTGTYQGGEGAVLQVQRFTAGSWGDFPVTVSVSGGTFSTYVQTSAIGKVKFRVVDSDTGQQSNPVTVQIG